MPVAIVPTVLEQKLVGESIRYVDNYIELNEHNEGTFLGPKAGQYSYKPQLRKRLTEIFESAKRCTNRWYVVEGADVRAAGRSIGHAMHYMDSSRVLVHVAL